MQHSKRRIEEILRNAPFEDMENRRIVEKWFSGTRPRDRLLENVRRREEASFGVVCDVGCGYGMYLLDHPVGSYGLELDPRCVEFARAVGCEVHRRNVIDDDLSDLPCVDTILAFAIIEHLDSPHVFLRKLHGLLRPGGRIILETPRKPPFRWAESLPLIGRLFGDHDDHVNSYTESTLAFACSRAGFQEKRIYLWSKPLAMRWSRLPPLWTGSFPLGVLANGMVYVGSKVEGWNYGPQATREVVSSGAKGYRLREPAQQSRGAKEP